ncbi:sensor histidine kinase [Aureitalea sp. L0-47]|uniref:sensor histidine kinase n=1 Tax=Aureitalea sp. L0-47 TaxID=2816962 RepID=UPI002237EB1C|nr:sensor histidine kinase [Aureitalea sp. L0-47]MCW5520591.1 sensor histidine kinase [Aureitalea sp. L0-47]
MEENGTEALQIVNVLFYAIGLLVLMAFAIVLFFYFSRRRIIKTELEKANREIEHQKEILQSIIITQEEERMRIAQDMHDAISSKLNVISLNANMLSDTTNTLEEAEKIAESIRNVTSTVLENSRKIAHDLLPPTLEKFGLEAALEELCDELSETGRFEIVENYSYPSDILGKDEELHLFRIAQELFNNAIKYSEANKINLSLAKENETIFLTYRDDGKGFNLEEAKMARSLGLSGMENRTEILKGELSMESSPGKGLFVQIQIDLS